MKANEALEKIYIGLIPSILGGHVYTTVNKDFPNAIEYTRTDAFIEKAERYIRNIADGLDRDDDVEAFINEFKKYMKGG